MSSFISRFKRGRFDLKELKIMCFFLLLAMIMDLSLNHLLAHEVHIVQRLEITSKLSTIRARLEERLNTNLYLVYGLATYISMQSDISDHDFDTLAKTLLEKSTSLKNIAAAPNFVIKYVYPLKGNETIVGLDYRHVPDQWKQALAAKETGQMILNGPLKLVQGIYGLVARIPVVTHEDGRFWGLVSSVIDVDEMFQQAGLDPQDQSLNVAIRGKDAKGDQGEIFWGEPELFDSGSNAVKMTVSLPKGSWQMAAKPKPGWAARIPYAWLIHFFVLVICILGCFGAMTQYRSKLRLIENENRVRSMSKASHDALIMADSKGMITFWNPAAEEMFGYSEMEVIGKNLHYLIAKPSGARGADNGMPAFAKTGQGPVINCVMEMEAVRKSGQVFPIERSVASFQFQGEWCSVGSVRDITARKAFEKQLTELATTDPLTGINNRRHFMAQAEAQLQQAIRYDRSFSLMMFDLDHFKHINDSYGHPAGDKVLETVAEVLRTVFRGVDIIGRIGGEEFAVAMPETEIEMAKQVAERLRIRVMETPVHIQGETINFTASIGVTQLMSPNATLSEIIKRADESLYEAKEQGRNRVVST